MVAAQGLKLRPKTSLQSALVYSSKVCPHDTESLWMWFNLLWVPERLCTIHTEHAVVINKSDSVHRNIKEGEQRAYHSKQKGAVSCAYASSVMCEVPVIVNTQQAATHSGHMISLFTVRNAPSSGRKQVSILFCCSSLFFLSPRSETLQIRAVCTHLITTVTVSEGFVLRYSRTHSCFIQSMVRVWWWTWILCVGILKFSSIES